MSLAAWSLIGFALWTLLILFTTVGWYRWSRILTGRQAISTFTAENVQGSDLYKRAMRAHANCIENLPVFAVIVLISEVSELSSPMFQTLAPCVLGARVLHSLVHVSFTQTNGVVAVRFAFYFAQIVILIAMAVILIRLGLQA